MFDRVAILDWSSAGVPKRGKDSIWLGQTRGSGITAINLATRQAAETALQDLCRNARDQEKRLLLGVDFGFGYPAGFAAAVTGQASALALWDWLGHRVTDDRANLTNYRVVAAVLNRIFPGDGPFWGDCRKVPTTDLPRKRPALPPGIGAHRTTEIAGRDGGGRPKSMWQLAYAGAVGAQSLTGIPVLHRLRRTFPTLRVWPYEDMADAGIVLAEVYPSLLSQQVKAHNAASSDEAQVRLLSLALYRLAQSGGLGPLFQPDQPKAILQEEGWILGVGHAELLATVLKD